jgi:hypothetical protein
MPVWSVSGSVSVQTNIMYFISGSSVVLRIVLSPA